MQLCGLCAAPRHLAVEGRRHSAYKPCTAVRLNQPVDRATGPHSGALNFDLFAATSRSVILSRVRISNLICLFLGQESRDCYSF